ncbi:hypothetical protein [Haloplanus salilacus]|uniref:hypothetical protein n=1 Tax=Haloplanus salilacus TaxID=2949994 RepID=UPI0030CED07A
MRPRVTLPVLLGLALVTAGCVGTPTEELTTTSTDGSPGSATATPTGTVDFPDGPKDQPARPSAPDESSVREYVRTHEYRYAYNSLWINAYTDVTLDCRVDDVSRRSWGYEAVVTCTGYSNTDVPENATATPGPHADWFTQTYRYRVSDGATERIRIENRDPV